MKVLSIIGTRPEVIKMASIITGLQNYSGVIDSKVCVTAQHRQMLDQMLDLFDIHPDYDLDLMTENQSLASFTASAIHSLESVIDEVQPDIVLVQGDTTTAMVAALVAFYHQITIGHVEAGMRTSDRYNPFPEEINRRLIGELTTYHFAPTNNAVESLLNAGVESSSIFLTGSTAVDAILFMAKEETVTELPWPDQNHQLILVTAHRRESFGTGLRDICLALRDLAERNQEIEILFPVHLNPRVRETVFDILSGIETLHLVEPMDYRQFTSAIKKASFILTDSGGIQTEAPALGKPVLVLRNETEWPEGIEAGVTKLIGTERFNIVKEAELLINDKSLYTRMAQATNPYGDGKSGEKIIKILMELF